MKRLFLGGLLALLLTTPVLAAGADPIIGSWKLNLSKSVFGGAPAVKSQTRTYSGTNRKFDLKVVTVDGAGQQSTTQITFQVDGKDYPSTGNADFDTVSGVVVDADTADFVLKRAGQKVGNIRRAVSKDGKTLTINTVLTNASGVHTSALMVYDRQS